MYLLLLRFFDLDSPHYRLKLLCLSYFLNGGLVILSWIYCNSSDAETWVISGSRSFVFVVSFVLTWASALISADLMVLRLYYTSDLILDTIESTEAEFIYNLLVRLRLPGLLYILWLLLLFPDTFFVRFTVSNDSVLSISWLSTES